MSDKGSKLFLSGIPVKVTKDEIVEFFSQFGKISHCKVKKSSKTKKSLGYVYLTFEDPKVSKGLLDRPVEFCGRMCEFKPLVEKVDIDLYLIEQNRKKIFVQDIPNGTTHELLKKAFNSENNISYAYVVKELKKHCAELTRCSGYVVFKSAHDLDSFLDKTEKIFIGNQQISYRRQHIEEVLCKKRKNTKNDRKLGRGAEETRPEVEKCRSKLFPLLSTSELYTSCHTVQLKNMKNPLFDITESQTCLYGQRNWEKFIERNPVNYQNNSNYRLNYPNRNSELSLLNKPQRPLIIDLESYHQHKELFLTGSYKLNYANQLKQIDISMEGNYRFNLPQQEQSNIRRNSNIRRQTY